MKRIYWNEPCIVLGVLAKEGAQDGGGDILTTRQSNVRMPGAKVRLNPGAECGIAHFLVQLKQVRMTVTDTQPENLRIAFRRERAEPLQRKKE
jgi:hypothetical protein